MPKFARAALLAMAMSAPVLAGAFMDHSVVSVLGAPDTGGGCSSNCSVGGSKYDGGGTGEINSGGKAEGGYKNYTGEGGSTFRFTGTIPANGGRSGSGHGEINAPESGVAGVVGTFSGNTTRRPWSGHCTGIYQTNGSCSTGPK